MDEKDLAREIHRRRLYGQSGAKRGQADSDARLCFRYGITPTIDNFVSSGMFLGLKDVSGRSVTVVFSDSNSFYVAEDLMETFDVVAFANGDSLFGWLGRDLILEAPKISVSKSDVRYKIGIEFLFEMPVEFDFVEPNISIPRVWDYRAGGWWTGQGFYIYDSMAAGRIDRIDEELLG